MLGNWHVDNCMPPPLPAVTPAINFMQALLSLYAVVGPTASGKTGLAIDLARRINGTIINMDSMQLYRELPILSAQPTADEQTQAPHVLYGVRAANEPANAAWWAAEAKRKINVVTATGGVPILCGGTGLYLQTLLEGIAPIPEVPASIRAEGASQATATLYDQLDAATRAKLKPGDTQRVLRAWEVQQATGRSLADWQAEPKVGGLTDYNVKILVLNPPRDALYARCDARFKAMLEIGALEEVRGLMAQDLSPDLPLLKACGYPELARHLRGKTTLAEAVSAGQQTTRNYAKRQVTWFTNQLTGRANVSSHACFGSEPAALQALAR